MEQQLYELLRQCTVRISVPGKMGHGTGFFVAPGLILTCAHVLNAAQSDTSPIEVYWNGQSYSAQISKLQQESDLALLQVNLIDHPCVYLHEEAIPFDALYSYGYPDDYPSGDPATFSLEGKAGEQLKFKTGQVRPGLSGAPLLNVRTGYVCGVVQLTRDRNNDLGGRAIPISNVFSVFPELVAQQQKLLQRDRRWMNCLWEVVARIKYLEGMHRRYGSVTLPIGPAEGISLQAVFQPLKMRRNPLAAEDLAREKRRSLLDEVTDSDSAQNQALRGTEPPPVIADNGNDALHKSPQRRMVILGGPGTGKTTVLKYLIGIQSLVAKDDPTAALPILLSLPDLARSGKTLKEYLLYIVQDMMIDDRYAEVLWKAIEGTSAFLCLDSLDEVEPQQRKKMIELVNTWSSFTGNTWIVGSRFTEYKGGQFTQGQFTEWELLPMTASVRKELAQRLLPKLQQSIKGTSESDPAAFVRALEQHSQAVAWGENPLLFSLAAVVFVRTGGLPSSRAALYREVIDAVLRIREQDLMRAEVLRNILAALALDLYLSKKGRTFTVRDLGMYLQEIRKRQYETWDITEISHRIIDSGTLEVVAKETYGFRHQTFQEYLAAVELAQRLVSQNPETREKTLALAWSKRTYSRWTEVLRLMVGVLIQEHGKVGRREAQLWVHSLIEQRTTPEGDPGHLGLALVLKSLSEVGELPDGKEMKIAQRLEEPIVGMWVNELLDAARHRRYASERRLLSFALDVAHLSISTVEAVVNLLVAALKDSNDNVRSAAVDALGALGNFAPVEPLVNALYDSSWPVCIVAIRALSSMGERTPIERLIEVVEYPLHFEVQREAIAALGALGKRIPIDFWLTALGNWNSDIRRAAVIALGQLTEDIPIEHLVTALQDKEEDVRAAAVEALTALGDNTPLEPLLAALQDKKKNVRFAAVKALGTLGKRVPIEPLIDALHDNDQAVCVAAVRALNLLGQEAPLEPLFSALKYGDINVRVQAMELLRTLGEPVSIDSLVAALYDGDKYERDALLRAIRVQGEQSLSDVIITKLDRPSIEMRVAAAEVLSQLGEQAPIEPLLSALNDTHADVRKKAIHALGALGERIPVEALLTTLRSADRHVRVASLQVLGERIPIELLLAALQDEDDYVRRVAVETLGKLGQQAPVEPLLIALQDEDVWVRKAAVEALGSLREHAPIEPLIAAMDHGGMFVGEAAVKVLSTLGERTPVEAFITALQKNRDYNVRQAAVKALGTLGVNAPIEPLVMALRDTNYDVRAAAVLALGSLGERAPVEVIVSVLEDRDGNVRAAAVRAVDALGLEVPVEPQVAALYDVDKDVRQAAVKALSALGRRAPIKALLSALYDEDWLMCWEAARALKALGGLVPIEHLISALKHSDHYVREAIVGALGARREPGVIESLISALHDEHKEVRRAAVRAIGAQGECAPIEALVTALSDEDTSVREAAVEALGTLSKHAPIESLITSLYDADSFVRRTAVRAFETLGTHAPIEPLIETLCDEDQFVREAVVQTLKKINPDIMRKVTTEAVAILLGESSDGLFDSLKQSFVAEVIGGIGSSSSMALEKLTQLLDWPYWQVRMKAVQALGKIRRNIPDAAIRRLLELRNDSQSSAVQEAADDALAEILSLETGIEDD